MIAGVNLTNLAVEISNGLLGRESKFTQFQLSIFTIDDTLIKVSIEMTHK